MKIELPDSALVLVILPASKPASKATSKPQKPTTALDDFLNVSCVESAGVKTLLFRDFHQRFRESLAPSKVENWSKVRTRRELIARGYWVEAGNNNKRYVRGLILKTERENAEPIL